MLYKNDEHIIGAAQPIKGNEVEKYIKLKDELLVKAIMLPEFLRHNNLNLVGKKKSLSI